MSQLHHAWRARQRARALWLHHALHRRTAVVCGVHGCMPHLAACHTGCVPHPGAVLTRQARGEQEHAASEADGSKCRDPPLPSPPKTLGVPVHIAQPRASSPLFKSRSVLSPNLRHWFQFLHAVAQMVWLSIADTSFCMQWLSIADTSGGQARLTLVRGLQAGSCRTERAAQYRQHTPSKRCTARACVLTQHHPTH